MRGSQALHLQPSCCQATRHRPALWVRGGRQLCQGREGLRRHGAGPNGGRDMVLQRSRRRDEGSKGGVAGGAVAGVR